MRTVDGSPVKGLVIRVVVGSLEDECFVNIAPPEAVDFSRWFWVCFLLRWSLARLECTFDFS